MVDDGDDCSSENADDDKMLMAMMMIRWEVGAGGGRWPRGR